MGQSLVSQEVVFAEGYDPPEDHGAFVHWVFWVVHGEGRHAQRREFRVILPRAVALEGAALFGLELRHLNS